MVCLKSQNSLYFVCYKKKGAREVSHCLIFGASLSCLLLKFKNSLCCSCSRVARDEEREQRIQNWKQEVRNCTPSNCTPPGLSDIKQVELYAKWRKFIPSPFQDEICPKPSDEVLDRVKGSKKEKREKKKSQKAATTKTKAASKKRSHKNMSSEGSSAGEATDRVLV